jgi:hypothetical protein
MALGDMQNDRPGFKEREIAFLIGRDLAERMQRQMRGLLQRARTKPGEPRRAGPRLRARKRTRISRASRLPPSGDCSKAVMVMGIPKLFLGEIIGCGAGKLSRQANRDLRRQRGGEAASGSLVVRYRLALRSLERAPCATLAGRIECRRMKAFISYASERRPTARMVYKFCKELGIHAFLDVESIVGGQDWNQEIKAAQRAADITFLIFSKESLVKPGVLQEEIREILRMIERRPIGDIYLVILRTEALTLPAELNRWQYIDLFKKDWRKHVAQSLRQKAFKMRVREPKGLKKLLSEGPAEKRPEQIRYRHAQRQCSLTADYFTYQGEGRFWNFVNAEIVAETHRGFYSSLSYSRTAERTEWSIRVEEFFRDRDLISLLVSHYVDYGGAHPNYGVTTLNFGGEEMGKLETSEILATDEATIQFIKRYCERDLQKELDETPAEGFDLSTFDQPDYWHLFKDINIDKLGIVINLSANQGLPHVMGMHTVRMPWETLRGKLQEEFCKTRIAKRLGLSAHGPIE